MISIGVAAMDLDGRADIEVGPGVDLELTIANTAEVDAAVTVGSKYWGDGGKGHREVPIGDVERDSTVTVGIDAAAFELPADPFDTSGNLMMWAVAQFTDGRQEISASLALAFHPIDGGWRIYDVRTRETTYEGGALTDDARARRQAALRRAPPGVRMGVAGLATQGTLPSEDGPPDPDHGGAP
jgi:hypothetical protein